jgi:hypothetical protein
VQQEVPAALQLPAVLRSAKCGMMRGTRAPRDRARRPGRAQRSSRCCPSRTSSPTRSASSAKSSSRTARARWRASAVAASRSWTRACPSSERGGRHRDGSGQGRSQGRDQADRDIQGSEDHYGDMDFKVTGTRNGITARADGHQVHGPHPRAAQEGAAAGPRRPHPHPQGDAVRVAPAARQAQPARAASRTPQDQSREDRCSHRSWRQAHPRAARSDGHQDQRG